MTQYQIYTELGKLANRLLDCNNDLIGFESGSKEKQKFDIIGKIVDGLVNLMTLSEQIGD